MNGQKYIIFFVKLKIILFIKQEYILSFKLFLKNFHITFEMWMLF